MSVNFNLKTNLVGKADIHLIHFPLVNFSSRTDHPDT